VDRLPTAQADRRASVLSYALNRWQTLAIVLVACLGVAGTIAFLDANPAILAVWVVFGLLGVGAMVLVSFRDTASVDDALSSNVNPGELRDRALREKVVKAQAYERAVRQAIRETSSPTLRESLALITREIADPVGLIFVLAKRLEAYRSDTLLQQDLRGLVAGRATLTEPQREQLTSLEKLDSLMRESAAAIDGALAQLGASYSAVQLARSAGELRGATVDDVLADLRTQRRQLSALNESLDEVYSERLRGRS
jgi:hypothetical protein